MDTLAEPADLERWVAECAELPDGIAVGVADLEAALLVREAIYQIAVDRMLDRPFDPASLEIVNDAAAGPAPTIQLSDAGLSMSGDLRAALTQIASSGIAMLADPDACLKECGRAGCTRIYLDRSRGARRTWCGMDECGNRVKAAAYRARRRENASPRR